MKLKDLLRRFRTLAKDKVEPYLFDTEDVVDWLNDAQAQACIRGRLLREDALPAMCRIDLVGDQHVYPLHPKAYEIIAIRVMRAGDVAWRDTVSLVTREWLDTEHPRWRDDQYAANMAIQDDITLRMVGKVTTGDVLGLECYRLPLVDLKADDAGLELAPEINAVHHEHLIQWALHKAFSVPDTESFDPNRSALAERAFTAYFGPMPDSDLRRATRSDLPQYNRGILM